MSESSFYETDRAVSEYLLFHYASQDEIMPYTFGPVNALNYPVRCVVECLDAALLPSGARALDLGCAVGRSTFELARMCRDVVGVDYSQRFIDTANEMKNKGSISYQRTDEGNKFTELTAKLPDGVDTDRVNFLQGDAMNLPDDLGKFDVVVAANLVDRLEDPKKFLNALAGLMNPGGQLVLASPYTWLEEYTPIENWLGGADNDSPTTIDALTAELADSFVNVRELNLPFLIREHARKFQWSVAHGTIWIRKGEFG